MTTRRDAESRGPSKHMAMAAIYQVAQPATFDFGNLEEWPKWLRRFERFRQASGLTEKSEEAQVNTLIYCMGEKADDTFKLSEEDCKIYSTAKEKSKDTS